MSDNKRPKQNRIAYAEWFYKEMSKSTAASEQVHTIAMDRVVVIDCYINVKVDFYLPPLLLFVVIKSQQYLFVVVVDDGSQLPSNIVGALKWKVQVCMYIRLYTQPANASRTRKFLFSTHRRGRYTAMTMQLQYNANEPSNFMAKTITKPEYRFYRSILFNEKSLECVCVCVFKDTARCERVAI